MNYIRAKSGPFPWRLWVTPEDVENLCRDALKEVSLYPDSPAPIRIERFLEKRFDVTAYYVEMPDAYLGCAQFDEYGLKKVCISKHLGETSSQSSQRRGRSTIAHEAGHGLLHWELWAQKFHERQQMELIGFDAAKPYEGIGETGFNCGSAALGINPYEEEGKQRSPWWEVQANMAMAALLLPWPLVTRAAHGYRPAIQAEHHLSAKTRLIEAACRELAGVFDVNPVMVRYRLQNWWNDMAQELNF